MALDYDDFVTRPRSSDGDRLPTAPAFRNPLIGEGDFPDQEFAKSPYGGLRDLDQVSETSLKTGYWALREAHATLGKVGREADRALAAQQQVAAAKLAELKGELVAFDQHVADQRRLMQQELDQVVEARDQKRLAVQTEYDTVKARFEDAQAQAHEACAEVPCPYVGGMAPGELYRVVADPTASGMGVVDLNEDGKVDHKDVEIHKKGSHGHTQEELRKNAHGHSLSPLLLPSATHQWESDNKFSLPIAMLSGSLVALSIMYLGFGVRADQLLADPSEYAVYLIVALAIGLGISLASALGTKSWFRLVGDFYWRALISKDEAYNALGETPSDVWAEHVGQRRRRAFKWTFIAACVISTFLLIAVATTDSQGIFGSEGAKKREEAAKIEAMRAERSGQPNSQPGATPESTNADEGQVPGWVLFMIAAASVASYLSWMAINGLEASRESLYKSAVDTKFAKEVLEIQNSTPFKRALSKVNVAYDLVVKAGQLDNALKKAEQELGEAVAVRERRLTDFDDRMRSKRESLLEQVEAALTGSISTELSDLWHRRLQDAKDQVEGCQIWLNDLVASLAVPRERLQWSSDVSSRSRQRDDNVTIFERFRRFIGGGR